MEISIMSQLNRLPPLICVTKNVRNCFQVFLCLLRQAEGGCLCVMVEGLLFDPCFVGKLLVPLLFFSCFAETSGPDPAKINGRHSKALQFTDHSGSSVFLHVWAY